MLLGHQPLIVPFDFVIQPVQRALHLRHPLHKLIALFYQQSLAGTDGLIPLYRSLVSRFYCGEQGELGRFVHNSAVYLRTAHIFC